MPIHQSDVDFTVFLETRNASRVKHERFIPSIRGTLIREYENETNKLLLILAAPNRKAS